MYSNNLICNILEYVDENISNKIIINDIEKKFFYNRFYIMKLFKKELNVTLVQYINSLRIYKSLILIKENNDNLLNVAFKCGFYSIEYFSETFKNIVGVNPQIAKNYLRNKKNINFKEIDLINNSLLNLYALKCQKEKYLKNRKPIKLPTKKLSIFK